jgi:hypothetical protein
MNAKTYWLAMGLGIISMADGHNSGRLSRAISGHKKSLTNIQQRASGKVKKQNRAKRKAARANRRKYE